VVVGGNVVATFTYGIGGTITLPADGSNPPITLIDSSDDQCQIIQNPGALISCSNTCLINATASNITCDNKGTTNDSGDDTYSFEITVTGFNKAPTWYVSGTPATTYPYNSANNFGPFLISGGDKNWIIVDKNDATCTFNLNIPAPPPCSDPCIIEYANLVIGDCNDNNTGTITSDDYFDISFVVNAINGNVTQYTCFWEQ
jgi:hypothetical protein